METNSFSFLFFEKLCTYVHTYVQPYPLAAFALTTHSSSLLGGIRTQPPGQETKSQPDHLFRVTVL
jgi:hypothetical protein